MSKKMHDILPPKKKEAKNKEVAVKIVKKSAAAKAPTPASVMENKSSVAPVKKNVSYQAATKELKTKNKNKRFPWIEILVGAVVIIGLLCVWGFFKLPKADIQIWPKTSTLTLSEKITANKNVTAADQANSAISAQYVEADQNSWQSFPATGSVSGGTLATGTITVYNAISPASPLTLKAGTHFVSDSGIYFVALAKIVVPAQKNGVPGSVSVVVQAQDQGTDSNIGPSKFSVPGLSGTPYYTGVYGQSTAAMTGGTSGTIKEVTGDDIKNAQTVLTQKLLALALASLKSKITSGQVLLSGATVNTVISASPNVKSGAVVDTFNEQASVKVAAIVFQKQDVQNIMLQDITLQLPSGTNLLTNSLTLTYSPQTPDMQNGKVVLDVQATATTYPAIDAGSLANAFAGQTADQIKQTLDQMYNGDVAQLKVNFWPFWVTAAPSDTNRIKVELDF